MESFIVFIQSFGYVLFCWNRDVYMELIVWDVKGGFGNFSKAFRFVILCYNVLTIAHVLRWWPFLIWVINGMRCPYLSIIYLWPEEVVILNILRNYTTLFTVINNVPIVRKRYVKRKVLIYFRQLRRFTYMIWHIKLLKRLRVYSFLWLFILCLGFII